MATTTIKSLGSIQSFGASISISYFPDSDRVGITTTNTADKRMKSITLIAGISIVDQLRHLLSQVDAERDIAMKAKVDRQKAEKSL